jgi:hypothetical protein
MRVGGGTEARLHSFGMSRPDSMYSSLKIREEIAARNRNKIESSFSKKCKLRDKWEMENCKKKFFSSDGLLEITYVLNKTTPLKN